MPLTHTYNNSNLFILVLISTPAIQIYSKGLGDPEEIYTDMEHGEGDYYTRMQKDDGSYIYVPMDGEGAYVEMNGKRYVNLNKDGEKEDIYVKKQSDDGSYHYVPMKGKSDDFCKIYDETIDRRLCSEVQNQPESDQYTSVDSEIYQNYQAECASDGQELYEDMERIPEGQDNPDELYTCMDMDSTSNDINVFDPFQSYYCSKQQLDYH